MRSNVTISPLLLPTPAESGNGSGSPSTISFCKRSEAKRSNEEEAYYIEVLYENRTSDPLKYRHDQWIFFDTHGHTFEPAKDFTHPHLYTNEKIYLGMTRVLNPGMKLRGWLAFVLPPATTIEYLQFLAGAPVKTVEFRITE
jgi:hypothetical protein